MVTYNMARTSLEQEVEHEEDLQSLREDLDLMLSREAKQAVAALNGHGTRLPGRM